MYIYIYTMYYLSTNLAHQITPNPLTTWVNPVDDPFRDSAPFQPPHLVRPRTNASQLLLLRITP